MIDHTNARTLASARADGELYGSMVESLDEHLAVCAECRAFSAGLGGLRALTAELPRVRAPESLGDRVSEAVEALSLPDLSAARRRRRIRRAIVAVAAVLAAALFLVLVPATPRFALREAGAAEALATIDSFYIERDIVELDPSGDAVGVTHERTWFRTPGLVRTERVTDQRGSPPVRALTITRPDARYVEEGSTQYVQTGVAPIADLLPEPLSPTIALYGTEDGAGPVIAGRQTARVVLELPGGLRRVAFVDKQRFLVLGGEQALVLGKESIRGAVVRERKTTNVFRIGVRIPDALFDIPRAPKIEGGFRPGSMRSFALAPRAVPDGFAVSIAGSGPEGDAVLFMRGALPILVKVAPARQGDVDVGETDRVEPVQFGRRRGVLVVGLYDVPRLVFTAGKYRVTISAPLPREALAGIAQAMYPA